MSDNLTTTQTTEDLRPVNRLEILESIDSARLPSQGPDTRSRYLRHDELDLLTQLPELYKQGQYPIYNKGPRGVDPKPYTIHSVLGDGQYYLERDGKCDRKVYRQENLQTEP